jgi:hypothetical protein
MSSQETLGFCYMVRNIVPKILDFPPLHPHLHIVIPAERIEEIKQIKTLGMLGPASGYPSSCYRGQGLDHEVNIQKIGSTWGCQLPAQQILEKESPTKNEARPKREIYHSN